MFSSTRMLFSRSSPSTGGGCPSTIILSGWRVDYGVPADKSSRSGQFTFRNVNGTYDFMGNNPTTGHPTYKSELVGSWIEGGIDGWVYVGGDPMSHGRSQYVADEFWIVKASGNPPKWGLSCGSQTGEIMIYEGGASAQCAVNIDVGGLYIDPLKDLDSNEPLLYSSFTIIRPFGSIY